MNGLHFVDAMCSGELPLPPSLEHTPMLPISWSKGTAEFVACPEERFSNPFGTMHGGWVSTLLDTVMGIAAQSTLPQGQVCATSDLSVRFTRPITTKIHELRVIGKVLVRGRNLIVTEGDLIDSDEKLYAHATSSMFILR